MTFPTASGTQVQAQAPTHHDHRTSFRPSPLPQSRETGDVLPADTLTGRPPVTKEESSAPVAKSWAHFVAGGLGGMTAAVLTSPLDVLKTRLQSDFYQSQLAATRAARKIPPPSALSLPRSAALHFQETFQILFSIHRIEGWRALFKGLGPNLTGVVPARAINFYTYGNGKRVISDYFNHGQEAAWVHLCAAATAGIVTSTATNPIWLVKTRLQLDKSHAEKSGSHLNRQYKNSLDCTMQVLRKEGIRGLYKGLSASYLGVSESTLQWVLYEQMKMFLARREARMLASGKSKTNWDHAVDWIGKIGAAGSAKFFAAIITYPHEVVRTRLRQAPTENGQLKYTGLIQCFRLIWKEEGLVSMYGGLTPHLLRVVPSAAIMFGMYEVILRVFDAE
ncbi:mitochondrial carrier [Xylona heveae TC161]|uniref:Mitochondrial carrier n=1 Tax=Xylona heveae (strain CBS 132557 / TC161) TaxID=1328760 RepID=A0A165AHK0_XYLHT|nr:mitochondrial carrier [Xylona heveae TC161]KZF20485.1 mitochondrial carrier [Xylona heveae TC161]